MEWNGLEFLLLEDYDNDECPAFVVHEGFLMKKNLALMKQMP